MTVIDILVAVFLALLLLILLPAASYLACTAAVIHRTARDIRNHHLRSIARCEGRIELAHDDVLDLVDEVEDHLRAAANKRTGDEQ